MKYKNLIGFNKAVTRIKQHVHGGKPNTVGNAIKIALKLAECMTKR